MAWVAKWLKRLDEKNAMVRPQELSPQDTRDKVSDKDLPAEKEGNKKTPADPAVVDLCSDGEDALKNNRNVWGSNDLLRISTRTHARPSAD